MQLSRQLADEMIAHARKEVPNEACGILASDRDVAVRFYPAINAERSPTRYSVDSRDLFRIHNDIESRGWAITGIFHSHTHTQAYPSSTDVSLASGWPHVYYLIASLEKEEPILRTFRIVDGKITEEPIDYQD